MTAHPIKDPRRRQREMPSGPPVPMKLHNWNINLKLVVYSVYYKVNTNMQYLTKLVTRAGKSVLEWMISESAMIGSTIATQVFMMAAISQSSRSDKCHQIKQQIELLARASDIG